MKRMLPLMVVLALSGCVINTAPEKTDDEKNVKVVTLQKEFPPQIWSDHKHLKISASACGEKSQVILNSLGFTHITKSPYGEYVYANYSNNRAAIKCVPMGEESFVYAIVSGPEKALVEKLRNEIVWQL